MLGAWCSRTDVPSQHAPQSTTVLGLAVLWLVFHRMFTPMVMRCDNAVQTVTGVCDAATIACALALGLNKTCEVNVT